MKKQDFEMKLKQSLHQSPAVINGKHFKHTLLLTQKEAHQKQSRMRTSFACFLSMQLKFIGWRIWSVQGIFLLVIGCLFFRSDEYMQNPRYMTKLLLCLSVLVFMTALPFIYRSVRYQMQEVEATTRFSSVKLLTAKLIVIGIGDIFLLGGIFLATIVKSCLQVGSAVFYLCFPFLLACGVCLFMLGHFTPKQFFVGSMALCSFFILTFAIVPTRYDFLFLHSFSLGWILIFVLLIVFCVRQFFYIIYDSPYVEMQIT